MMGDNQMNVDLVDYIEVQKEWSERVFGPGQRTKGICEHIRKELAEIEQAPADLMEWIDVVILALDGAWRAGHSAESISKALVEKFEINLKRKWPMAGPENRAIEHIKENGHEKRIRRGARADSVERKGRQSP
jgi:hypothetical protein